MKGIVQIVQKKGAIFLQKKIFFLIERIPRRLRRV
jgi:hypothetical protein